MIQPETLKSLNYFIDEDMETHKDNLDEGGISAQLESYNKGYINALEYVRHLINQPWMEDNSTENKESLSERGEKMKSRLEQIETANEVLNHNNPAWKDEIYWLISQTKKLEEYEKQQTK